MARPSLNHDVVLEIYRLRSQNKMSIDKILDELSRASDRDETRYHVPARRTVAKYVKRYDELPDKVKQLDNPFEWHRLEEYGLPWESSSYLLEAWTYFEEKYRQPLNLSYLSIRRARWWWRIHLVAPDLGRWDTAALAENFVLREMTRDLLGINVGMNDLEAHIAYKPWLSEEHRSVYLHAIEEGRIPRIHVDYEMAESYRVLWGTEFGRGGVPAFLGSTDNTNDVPADLLFSQLIHVIEQLDGGYSLEEAVASALKEYRDYDLVFEIGAQIVWHLNETDG